MGFDPVCWSFCMKNIAHYLISGSLALGSKQSGQSKAFWYYQAEKRHLWRRFYHVAWWRLCPHCSLIERVFLQVCIQGNMSLLYFMSSLCWNNILLLCLIVVVFVHPKLSFRLSESWNWLRKDAGLNSLRRLCCYEQSWVVPALLQGVSFQVFSCLPACSPPLCQWCWGTAEISKSLSTEILIFIRTMGENGALCWPLIFFTGFWRIWDH